MKVVALAVGRLALHYAEENPDERPTRSSALSHGQEDLKEGTARTEGAVQTKGHRVIAMPLCSTGLAPPAFTAPCRNQTGDSPADNRKRCARSIACNIKRFHG
jgi:hypothetical protein